MVQEYLTENSLRKYPFTDLSSLIAEDAYKLADDYFLDAQCVFLDGSYDKGYLSNYTVTGSTLAITLTLTGNAGSATSTFSLTGATENEVFTDSSTHYKIKFIVGAGFVRDGVAFPTGNHTFASTAAVFERSALVVATPRVTSIVVYNSQKTTDELAGSPTATITATNPFEIIAGANLDLTDNQMTIQAGLGTGLYNGCDVLPTGLITINDIPPDSNNNFTLTGDDCYLFERGFNTQSGWVYNYGLTIQNTCSPKCTPEQIQAYAYYNNRVGDFVSQIGTDATSLLNAVTNAISEYISKTLPVANLPLLSIKTASTEGGGGVNYDSTSHPRMLYCSLAAGFFNTTEYTQPVNYTVDATYTDGSTGHTETGTFIQGDLSINGKAASLHSTFLVPPYQYALLELVYGHPPDASETKINSEQYTISIHGNFGSVGF